MKAAIYMRTSKQDKAHKAYSLAKQEEHTRALATRHGLRVAFEHVYSDLDCPGDAPPACWAPFDYEGITRPALGALIQDIADGNINYLIVRRMDRLGTSSDSLMNLLQFLTHHHVRIIAPGEDISSDNDPGEAFAISILKPVICYDTKEDAERKQKIRTRKIEEIERLKAKVYRLEAELKELDT